MPGVEYHAMDSDTEDAFYAEPPKAAGYHHVICNVLVNLFRAGGGWGSRVQNATDVRFR